MSGYGYNNSNNQQHYGSDYDPNNDPYNPQQQPSPQPQQYGYGGGGYNDGSRDPYHGRGPTDFYNDPDGMSPHQGGYGGGGGIGIMESNSSVRDEDLSYAGEDPDDVDDDALLSRDDDDVLGDDIDDDIDNDHDEEEESAEVDFDDPEIANLPRILLMGPRRAGKTSIQRVVFHKMSPHETLFRLEATQSLERSVVDHTPLCRFTICDFPGDYYGPEINNNASGGNGGGQGTHNTESMTTDTWGNLTPTASSSIATPEQHQQQQNHMHPYQSQQNQQYNSPYNESPHLNQQQQQHSQYPHLDGLPNVIGGNTNNGNNTSNPNNDTDQAHEADTLVFGRATALIFVLDAQDEPYDHVLQHFTETVKRAARANPHIAIEVFINKVDGELFLSDEAKYDCRRDVMQQVTDELADVGVMPETVPISYYLTSIYDHSVFEAFSRVVQKLIPQLPTLENLLNVLVSTCSMEKAYLFDVATKLYISTDSSPVDMLSVELCSDMIDVVLDVSGIYGLPSGNANSDNVHDDEAANGEEYDAQDGTADYPSTIESVSVGGGKALENGIADEVDGSNINAGEVQSQFTGESSAADFGNGGGDELVGTLISQEAGAIGEIQDEEQELDADSAYDGESSSVIRLSNGMILYLKEVDTMLALVCLTRAENFRKKGLINYNIGCLKKALRSLGQPTPSV